MNSQVTIALIGGIIGGGGLVASILNFTMFLINRKDTIKEKNDSINNSQDAKLNNIEKRISCLEKGTLRTQLLQLMSSFENRHEEIIKVAKSYFMDHDGDWYVTTIFYDYLNKHNLLHPNWFDYEYHKNKEKSD